MAGRIRTHDWAATPLGPISGWSCRLKVMVEQMLGNPLVSALVCGSGCVLLYNDAAALLYGDHHPGALGLPLPQAFPQGWASVAPLYARAFAGESVHVASQPVDTRGEGDRASDIFDAVLVPVLEDDGSVAYVHMSGVEVAGAIQAKAALRDSEERFRALVTATSYAVYSLGPDWTEMRRLEGRGFLVDTPSPSTAWLNEYIVPEDWPRLHDAIQAAVSSKGVFELEHRVRRADGSVGWTLSRAIPLLDPDGAIREWFGAASDITERRRAEAALRESEAKYRGLFESINAGYCVIEVIFDDAGNPVDYVFLEANPAFEVQTGLSGVSGKSMRSIVPEHEAFWFQTYGRIAQTGQAERFEHRAAALGRWYNVYAFRTGSPHQHRVGVLFDDVRHDRLRDLHTACLDQIGRDLARLSLPNEIMEAVGARLGAVLDVSACHFCDVDEANGVVSVRHGWTAPQVPNLTGTFRLQDFLTDDFIRASHAGESFVVHDATHDYRIDAVQPARMKVGAFVAVPLLWSGRWSGYVCVTSVQPRDWRADEVEFLVEVANRLFSRIERVRAEAALRESERSLRVLIEGIPQLVWRSAAGGMWTWAGPQWIAFTGLSDAASRDLGWLDAVHPEDRPVVQEAWRRAPDTGLFEADHRVHRAANDEWRWFQTRGALVRGGMGGTAEWLGTCTDIEDQVQARAVLTRASEDMEQLVAERTAELMAAEESLRQSQKMEAVGRLTGGIAHDFNNMLQGVAGALEMAHRRIATDRSSEAVRYLEMAQAAADRAAGLTRRLLAFARRQRLDPKLVDPDDLVRGMTDLVRRTVGPSVRVAVQLRDGSGAVLCDPNELESVLLNLCINARDAMPDGGRLVLCTEDLELAAADLPEEGVKPGRFVGIAISDTGTGISPEVLAQVFDPFFTTKPLGQGTGLGLSQVWGFVQQSGGVIRVESELDRGTTFRLLLPLHPFLPQPEKKHGREQAGREVAVGIVLLVDDEDAARGPTAEWLRDLGYTVREARDGAEALRSLAELRPDMLVTDIGLPGEMNGWQLSEAARARAKGLPVLFVTGYAGRVTLPPDAEVIAKPFSLAELSRRISAILDAATRDP